MRSSTLFSDVLGEDAVSFDVTTLGLLQAFPVEHARSLPAVSAQVVVRQSCVASGHTFVEALLAEVASSARIQWHAQPGDGLNPHNPMATLTATMPDMLALERVILNVLQVASATATQTRRFVDALDGTGVSITHTRKTIPGLRSLQRQAVLDGGGRLHRGSLAEAALVKDNHWAWLTSQGISPEAGLLALRRFLPHTARLCVEVDSLAQLVDLLATPTTASLIDVILLDNFSPDQIQQAIGLIDGRAVVEVSGGITLETIHDFALPGVDIISTSQLTFGCPNIDIGLDFTS